MKGETRRFLLMVIGVVALGIIIMYSLTLLGDYSYGNIFGWDVSCLSPSGDVTRETRNVGSFSGVILAGPAKLYVTQGGINSLGVEAQENVLDIIETSVNGGVLTVGFSKCITTFLASPVNVYVSMEDVKSLSVRSSGDIIGQTKITSDDLVLSVISSGNIDLDVDTEQVSTTISSSGNVNLKGDATTHDITISSSGNVNAYDLATEKAIVRTMSSGSSYISVSDQLDITILSSGSVFYKGSPSITQTIVSSGRVVKTE